MENILPLDPMAEKLVSVYVSVRKVTAFYRPRRFITTCPTPEESCAYTIPVSQ
jgi:hypothetical protein